MECNEIKENMKSVLAWLKAYGFEDDELFYLFLKINSDIESLNNLENKYIGK